MKFNQAFGKNYDEMNFLKQNQKVQSEETSFSVKTQNRAISMHDALLLKKKFSNGS